MTMLTIGGMCVCVRVCVCVCVCVVASAGHMLGECGWWNP